ncbi:MAG: hypothetical protein DCC59_07855 [Chloroflexi bacterium]|nr:MAG: hypothetical protein DCC59_07855 [Chloroflexota bacterium]
MYTSFTRTFNLQPVTFNLQPSTCNLQPSTLNLQPSTSNLIPPKGLPLGPSTRTPPPCGRREREEYSTARHRRAGGRNA